MIIITTKDTTRFINEVEFIEVRYHKDRALVVLVPKNGKNMKDGIHDEWLIEDVVSVRCLGGYMSCEEHAVPVTPTELYVRKRDADMTRQMYDTCMDALMRLSGVCTAKTDRQFAGKQTRQDMLNIISDCFEKCSILSGKGRTLNGLT